jgi:hypothetical protein
MEHAAYLKEIVDAYQAEVRGEATFSMLAEHVRSEDEREIWQTLTRLESTTRERLKPLLQRYGLDTTPVSEQWRLGQERGRARAAAGFAATIQSMTESLRPYLTLYARLEAEGPAEDRSELEFLNAHEIALHEFAMRAVAGGGRDSLAPVWALLDPVSRGGPAL